MNLINQTHVLVKNKEVVKLTGKNVVRKDKILLFPYAHWDFLLLNATLAFKEP